MPTNNREVQQLMDLLGITELRARQILRDRARILRQRPVMSKNFLK